MYSLKTSLILLLNNSIIVNLSINAYLKCYTANTQRLGMINRDKRPRLLRNKNVRYHFIVPLDCYKFAYENNKQ